MQHEPPCGQINLSLLAVPFMSEQIPDRSGLQPVIVFVRLSALTVAALLYVDVEDLMVAIYRRE
jgi:hypothetical protein